MSDPSREFPYDTSFGYCAIAVDNWWVNRSKVEIGRFRHLKLRCGAPLAHLAH